jgi:hypothetical protein
MSATPPNNASIIGIPLELGKRDAFENRLDTEATDADRSRHERGNDDGQ